MLIVSSAASIIKEIINGDSDAPSKLSKALLKKSEIPTLLSALTCENSDVRASVSAALGNFSANDFAGTNAEPLIFQAITTLTEQEKYPLIFVLGKILTPEALDYLCGIVTDESSKNFTRTIALDALKNAGALAYSKVDALRDFARKHDDKEVKEDIRKCLFFICNEVKDLYTKTFHTDLSDEFFGHHQPATVLIPDEKTSTFDSLTIHYDGRVSYSPNGTLSSCRLILIQQDERFYCLFSQDEFSFGTSVTNAAGFLIQASKDHFKLDVQSTVFIQAQLRGHDLFDPNNELSMMIPPSEGEFYVREWLPPGVINRDLAECLIPYLDREVPLPSGFNFEEALINYTPPANRHT